MSDKIVVAEYDFEGQDDSQLSFQAGDRIIVKEEDESGWWMGVLEKNNKEGFFPSTYISSPDANNNETEIHNDNDTHSSDNNNNNSDNQSPIVLPNNQFSGQQDNMNLDVTIAKDIENYNKSSGHLDDTGRIDPNAENYYSQSVLNLKVNPNSKTRFGLTAHYMSYASSLSSFFIGIAGCEWSGAPDYLGSQEYKDLCLYAGVYCILLSIVMFIWEFKFGVNRKRHSLPFRGVFYVIIGVFPCITLVTALVASQWFVTGIFEIMGWVKFEEYLTDEHNKGGGSDGSGGNMMEEIMMYIQPSFYVNKTKNWFINLRQQSKVRKYLFVLVFSLFNIIYVIERCVYYSSIVNEPTVAFPQDTIDAFSEKNGGNGILTGWFPVAKMFGNLLDINCAFILLPVCRSFIRSLYNMSTDQTARAKVCNTILSFMPLDKAIQWHKMMSFLIVIGTVFHTWAHYMHYASVPYTYDAVFGATVWVSGILIILSMQLIYCTSFMAVRHGKFEMFWYTHHLFIIFFIATLFHGAGSINPNFWKWFLVPGFMYTLERTMREIRSKQPIGVVSVTHLNNNLVKVFCLELEKTGPIKHFQEGQYIFIKAPIITPYQWHPFTISSPPDQNTLTLHIRNMGAGTWTDRLQTFFQSMSPNKAYYEAYHREGNVLVPQKFGPDGNNLICIDGPMAAPTQHLGEYSTAIIVGAGIGVTPVRATLQSIVYFRFKRGIGHSYPDTAYCVWIVNYGQLDAYRFMVRTLKECEDELYDMRKKNASQMTEKLIQMHIFVTRVPANAMVDENEIEYMNDIKKNGDRDSDLALWGPHYNDMNHNDSNNNARNESVATVKAPFDEIDIWRVLKQPNKMQPTQIGDIIVHNGRPNWEEFFGPIQQTHKGSNIGVMFCGPSPIAKDLKKHCGMFTDLESNTKFILHKENF